MRESKQVAKFTVFSACDYAISGKADYPLDLESFIQVFAMEDPYRPPIAWMVGGVWDLRWKSDCEASIAAGRLIEKIDGKWVALGVEKPAAVIHDSDCSLHNAPALLVGPCDCSVDNAAMIARDGPAKPIASVTPPNGCLKQSSLCTYPHCLCYPRVFEVPTAKPAISGLQRVYSSTHLLGSYR